MDKIYSVCHKCGLQRGCSVNGVRTPKIEELSYCQCMSQSVFDYELTLRTKQECKEIAQEHYNSFYALYVRQGRAQSDMNNLKVRYGIA